MPANGSAGSSISVSIKLGSGAGSGAATGAGLGGGGATATTAGSSVAGLAGASASAASALGAVGAWVLSVAVSASGVAGFSGSAVVAAGVGLTGAAGAAGAVGALGAGAALAAGGETVTGAATGTVMLGAAVLPALASAAVPAAALPAGAEAALSLFSSSMFLANSCARAAASLACLRWASCSSVDFLPCSAPLDRVSLSGVALPVRLSSVRVCTVPVAERSAAACCVTGAAPASLRRNSLKSRLCSAMIWRASVLDVVCASSVLGSCKTAPALMRWTLPWMKASGLPRIMATSIWSSETPPKRWVLARRPAVSPGLTVTLSAAGAGWLLGWVAGGRCTGSGAGRGAAFGAGVGAGVGVGGVARGVAGLGWAASARTWARAAARVSAEMLDAAPEGAAAAGAVAAGARAAGAALDAGAEVWADAVTVAGVRRSEGGSNSMV